MLRIDQTPKIDVHLIKSVSPPGGIGETGANAGPPALRNAIYAANRRRLAQATHRSHLDRGEEIMSPVTRRIFVWVVAIVAVGGWRQPFGSSAGRRRWRCGWPEVAFGGLI